MLDVQYQRAIDLLTEKREELELLAQVLLEKEVLLKSDVERLVGARPFDVDDVIPTESKSDSAITATDIEIEQDKPTSDEV